MSIFSSHPLVLMVHSILSLRLCLLNRTVWITNSQTWLPELPTQLSKISLPRPSVQFSCSVMSDSLQPHEPQHARPPCPSLTPGVYLNSCPLSQWYHPTISSFVVPFSSCPQSFPASGSFQMSQALRIRWPKYWSFSFNISPSN